MEIVYLTFLTIAGSFVGTVTGFGASTLMVPLVLLFLPVRETLLLVGIIHWFGDLWKIFLFKHGIRWKILLFFGIPGVILSVWGASLTFQLSENVLSRFVGAVLIVYSVFTLLKPRFKLEASNRSAFWGGAGSGFLGGISGVGGGALRAVVLTAFHLPKEVYLFTSGLLGFAIDASRITTYFLGGTRLDHGLSLGLLLFIPTSFVGALVAKKVVDKITPETFKKVIVVFLFLVGLSLLISP